MDDRGLYVTHLSHLSVSLHWSPILLSMNHIVTCLVILDCILDIEMIYCKAYGFYYVPLKNIVVFLFVCLFLLLGTYFDWTQAPNFISPVVGRSWSLWSVLLILAGVLGSYLMHVELWSQLEIWMELMCRIWCSFPRLSPFLDFSFHFLADATQSFDSAGFCLISSHSTGC